MCAAIVLLLRPLHPAACASRKEKCRSEVRRTSTDKARPMEFLYRLLEPKAWAQEIKHAAESPSAGTIAQREETISQSVRRGNPG